MVWFILVDLRVFLSIFLDLFRYLTIGIRALSLAKEGKNFLVLFADFLKGKKGATHFRLNSETFCSEFVEKIGYLNSSRKNTQFQKKNQSKWSLGSEVINILNSTNFQGFSGKSRVICTVSYF
jgi:hypothetical protein